MRRSVVRGSKFKCEKNERDAIKSSTGALGLGEQAARRAARRSFVGGPPAAAASWRGAGVVAGGQRVGGALERTVAAEAR